MTGKYQLYETQLKARVEQLFNSMQTPDLMYHNLGHTCTVVARTREIAFHYGLDEAELFVLTAAAWFHDTGHLTGTAAGHEERSVLLMKDFLKETGLDYSIIFQIENCILSTIFPANPQSLPAAILCDADLYNLGTPEFIVTDELVKKEFELRNQCPPSSWDEATLKMLERHRFFTDYCIQLLQAGKQRNIDLLKQRIRNKE